MIFSRFGKQDKVLLKPEAIAKVADWQQAQDYGKQDAGQRRRGERFVHPLVADRIQKELHIVGCGGVADTARSFVTSKDRDGRKIDMGRCVT